MSTNIIEQKPQEIDFKTLQSVDCLPIQSSEPNISQPYDNNHQPLTEDDKGPKRSLDIQDEEGINSHPTKKTKLSVEEELRQKIQNFKPFTRKTHLHGNHNNTQTASSNFIQPTAKFQVVKGTFIIEIALVNKAIQITASSRIDDAFILIGSITKEDIPESLQRSGYTLASQVFNQMSKHKDYLEVDPLMNLKIVIIEEKGAAQMIRKFRFPLTQKTLSFEEQYMKKMKFLEEQNHRLQYQLSQIAMEYENELEQQRKMAQHQRRLKQGLLKELQQFKKIDVQDLEAKSTIDLAGIIEINDREKYRPVVAIEQEIEEINPQFAVQNSLMNAPVVDIDKLTIEKNYSDSLKNKDYLRMVEMIQKFGQNSASIDKNFLSLMIDIILSEDKKKTRDLKSFQQIQLQPSQSNFKPVDISVYSKKFLSGQFNPPQAPEVQILTPPKPIAEKKPLINEKEDLKAEARRLKAQQKTKKLIDHKIEEKIRQKAEKQLAQFLGFSLVNKNEIKNVEETQNNKPEAEEDKRLKDKYFGPFESKKNISSNPAIELQEKAQQANEEIQLIEDAEVDQEIQLIQDPTIKPQISPKPQSIPNNDNKLNLACEIVQLPSTPQSTMLVQKNNALAQRDQESIEILDLDIQGKKDVMELEDDMFMSVRPTVLHERRNQPLITVQSDQVRPKQKSEIYITKVIPRKEKQPKPLKLNLNHFYQGENPGISRQQEDELLNASHLKRMRPRLPKVYETSEYSDKKQIWKQFATSLDTDDLTLLLNDQNYGNVHKIFKANKLFGTMAWVELFYSLRVLDLTKNNITYIEGLKNLKGLQKLDLSQNLITKMQNMDSQIHMRQLHLSENKIQMVENIFHMKKMDTLSIQGNCLFEINDQVGKIESLRYLYLQNNRIKKLKPALKNLRLMAFMIYGNGMNYDETGNQDVIQYIRSTYCSVHLENFLSHEK